MPPRDTPIRVLVVDDYAVVRQCLPPFLSRLVDDITVVGVTGSGAEAVQAIGKLRPNVVLLGLTLPDMRRPLHNLQRLPDNGISNE